ncbi:MAG: EAL domain-containing protein, partial [Candidatus Dormibacteraeota bacterium]|nr:EAL domain-containing protein [Candidatus Dormibacteraeota bacterium]
KGVLRFIDGSAVQATGLTPEQLVGRTVYDLIGSFPQAAGPIKRAFTGEPIAERIELFGRTWEIRTQRTYPTDGSLPLTVGVATDVTDAAAAERAVAHNEERLRALLENSHDMISVLSPEGKLLYVSDAVQRYAPAGATTLDTSVDAWFIDDDKPIVAKLFADVVSEPGRTAKGVFRFVHADDGLRYAEAIAHNALDNPAVRGVVVNTRDVTDVVESRRELERSEERFRELVENATDAVTVFSADGTRTYASPAALRLHGVSGEQELSALDMQTMYGEYLPRVMEGLAELQREPGATKTLRYSITRPDGTTREIEATARNALDVPAIQGIVMNARDITDAARAESLLEMQARVLTMIAGSASLDDTLMAIAAEMKDLLPNARCAVQLVNDGALNVAAAISRRGLACMKTDGKSVKDRLICTFAISEERETLVHNPGTTRPWAGSACFGGEPDIATCWVTPIRKDRLGDPVGVLSCYFNEHFEPDGAARSVVATAAELAAIAIERRNFEERLSYQAMYDALTGLPNRTHMVEHLRTAAAHSERTSGTNAVLFIDIDRFKLVNDSLGHEHGDAVLREVGRRIEAAVRAGDKVARFGGDEFVVSCSDVDDEHELVRVARRLLESIGRPLQLGGHELRLTASIGIALNKGRAHSAEAMLRNADAAMYLAKDRGRDRWELFDTKLRKRAQTRLRMESALRAALEKGALEVWYQPVVSAATGKAVSLEALVRWQRDGKLVAPGEFIPVAEETGLISTLGAWVLEQACRDVAAIPTPPRALPIHVSVNASARQLIDGSLVPAVRGALDVSGLGAPRVTIEVTESALLADHDAAVRTVHELQRLHVGIALDDFGTGFSSLSFLKQFPGIDIIKIDRSFISDSMEPTIDRAIVRAIAALASAQGADVIAEGVETYSQLFGLVDLGVDAIQGFLAAKPMPIAELREALV